jgi:2-oxoacid:acceptor oxidoreductase delta subunit (pyruvate/2-ketoisovalerate family)
LARQVHGGLPAGDFLARQAIAASCLMHVPTYAAGPQGLPIIYAPGNSAARHTGSWRIFRPLIDLDACTRCGICFSYCPDAAIMLDPKGYPAIDYDNCKGCMICYRECPLKCIREEKEVRAW